MIKYYIIPAEFVTKDKLLRRPKYLEDLKVNWAGAYIESKDVYAVYVNAEDALHGKLAANADVFLCDGTQSTKTQMKTALSLDTIPANADEFEFVGKLDNSAFSKADLYVG